MCWLNDAYSPAKTPRKPSSNMAEEKSDDESGFFSLKKRMGHAKIIQVPEVVQVKKGDRKYVEGLSRGAST